MQNPPSQDGGFFVAPYTLAARKRMELLLMRLEQSGAGRVVQRTWNEYHAKLVAKFDNAK